MIELADRRAALRVAAALTALTAAVAFAVWAVDPAAAREKLGFTFPGIPARFDEVGVILANNLRLLGVVLGGCLVAQLLRSGRDAGGLGAVPAWALLVLCDGVLALMAGLHVLIVGAALGAHGERMVWVLLPHGPFELAAYSLALGLYLAARRERLTRRRVVAAAGMAAALLLAGAVVEVYVQL